MKTSLMAARSAAPILAAALTTIAPAVFAQNGNAYGKATDPLIPVGRLSAFPTLVQTGTHPTLTWAIQYPEDISNIATVEPGGTIDSQVDLCMQVQVIGGSYQIGSEEDGTPIYGYMQAQVEIDGLATWTTFFYSTEEWVLPTHTYAKAPVGKGQKVNFRARGYNGVSWETYRTTSTSSHEVLALVNGAELPKTIGAFAQGSYENFLKPYLDAGGNVRIGPKDVLILFEIDETDPTAAGYDFQDLGLLVSFDYCKNNNGHGNNVDGVDVSNPSGNKADDDTDPTVDDENKGSISVEP